MEMVFLAVVADISNIRTEAAANEAAEAVATAAAPVEAPLQREWKFAQVFGERTAGEEVQEGTIRSVGRICCTEQSDLLAHCFFGIGGIQTRIYSFSLMLCLSGRYSYLPMNLIELAIISLTGDRGGRVSWWKSERSRGGWIFQLTGTLSSVTNTEFQIHERESLEIEEKFNKIKMVPGQPMVHCFFCRLMTKPSNFGRFKKRRSRKYVDMNVDPAKAAGNGSSCRSKYINKAPNHYTANGGCLDKHLGLSNDFSFPPGVLKRGLVPSDGETFISADDLRIKSLEFGIKQSDVSYIVDVMPANHGGSDREGDNFSRISSYSFVNMLAYSLRTKRCLVQDPSSRRYLPQSQRYYNLPGMGDIFLVVITLTLKTFVICMNNDSIFDNIRMGQCCLSGEVGLSSGNLVEALKQQTLEAARIPLRRQVQTPSRPSRSLGTLSRGFRRGADNSGADTNGNAFDFTTKLLHLAWHPTENSLACAASNSLYMYYA
ncbi:hypothetical protein NC652_017657 [Populus alba x Populus x berolinensis]|nr:hypothetical protein NC652_017657 [Populus alba x Populus x berolinensis]